MNLYLVLPILLSNYILLDDKVVYSIITSLTEQTLFGKQVFTLTSFNKTARKQRQMLPSVTDYLLVY